MENVSYKLLGLELKQAESLLQAEEVNFVVEYTKANREKKYYESAELIDRVVRVIQDSNILKLTVCKV